MRNNIKTEFTVDRENNTIKIRREFTSPKDHVWAAWTEKELIDQWWAPKPWKSETRIMDFKVGGRRLYAMVGPEGEKHWALADYTSITPKTNLTYRDGFCDSKGNINQNMPRSNWNVDFTESNKLTTVNVEIKYEKLSDLEKVIEMGIKEGLTATWEELAEILPTLNKSKQ